MGSHITPLLLRIIPILMTDNPALNAISRRATTMQSASHVVDRIVEIIIIISSSLLLLYW
jgi:hypothetical protein